MPSRTLFKRMTVDSINPSQILPRDPHRIGYTIIQRTTTPGNVLYLSKDRAVRSTIVGGFNAIQLLENDTLTMLATEGDDCTDELWGIGFAACVTEIIETTQ